MSEEKWIDDRYLDAYDYSRQGMGNVDIAKALGVTYKTFKRWMRKRPTFRNAILRGRRLAKEKTGNEEFREYVYERLTEDMKETWDKLNAPDTEGNPIERVEAMLEGKGKTFRQHLFLYALVHYNFNPSDAMRAVGISKTTLDRWTVSDPKFAQLVQEVNWHKKNFFEGLLVKAAKAGETGAILHGNKVYNADRGHNTKVTFEHMGEVQHNHRMIPIDDLGLEIGERKKLLQAIRDRQMAAIPHSAHEDVIEDAEFVVKTKRKKNGD
jgi:hypothetical protein